MSRIVIKAARSTDELPSKALLASRCKRTPRRPPTSNLGGDDNRLRSSELSFERRRLCFLEAFNEPTPRGPGRTVGSIDRRHLYRVASGRRIFRHEFNQRAACQVRLDSVQRHAAETEARAQESQLGAEMGKAPGFRVLDTRSQNQ